MLTIYADASYVGGMCGLALVCITFTPWIAEAWREEAKSSVEAERMAVVRSAAWARELGHDFLIFNDCQAAVRHPLQLGLPRRSTQHIKRGRHPAHAHADRLARRALREGPLVQHRVDEVFACGWYARVASR